jgi:hypothetical protein
LISVQFGGKLHDFKEFFFEEAVCYRREKGLNILYQIIEIIYKNININSRSR